MIKYYLTLTFQVLFALAWNHRENKKHHQNCTWVRNLNKFLLSGASQTRYSYIKMVMN